MVIHRKERWLNSIEGVGVKGVGYIRVSTTGQKDGNSPTVQRDQITKYCDLKNIELIDIIEESKSGKNVRLRPGFKRVIATVQKEKFDAVVVSKLDRGFRSTQDALEIIKKLDKKGISFHSVAESIDTRSAMGRFFLTIMAACAELESARLSERMSDVWAFKKANGEKVGGYTPYGFWAIKGKLIPNPKEQAVIHRIKNMADSGVSLSKISEQLNAEGVTTKQGNKWYAQSIKNMIRSD